MHERDRIVVTEAGSEGASAPTRFNGLTIDDETEVTARSAVCRRARMLALECAFRRGAALDPTPLVALAACALCFHMTNAHGLIVAEGL